MFNDDVQNDFVKLWLTLKPNASQYLISFIPTFTNGLAGEHELNIRSDYRIMPTIASGQQVANHVLCIVNRAE
jgi:hypothetical protein